MTLFSRYVISQILATFAVILGVVVCVYLAVDFFEKIDDFMEAGLPMVRMAAFFSYQIPFVLKMVIPAGVLLSVIVVVGLMNRHNELTALQASGVSLFHLLRPCVFMGVLFTICLFAISEQVVPNTMDEANRIWNREVRKRNLVRSRKQNVWIKDNKKIIHVAHYDPGHRIIHGISVNDFDENFVPVLRLDAEKAEYKGGKTWLLFNVMMQRHSRDNDFSVAFRDSLSVELDLVPEDFQTVTKSAEEMSYPELAALARDVEREGYDATRYRVDLYEKLAHPFTCLILCLIGMGVGIRKGMGHNLPLAVSLGVGISFLYFILNGFCVSLGYGAMISPVVAVWLANLVFSLVAGVLLLGGTGS